MGFDVDVIRDPKLMALLLAYERMLGCVDLLINDLTSLKKEVVNGKLDFNYVYITARRDGLTAQQAVDSVIALIRNELHPKFLQMRAELLTHKEIPGFDKYVNAIHEVYETYHTFLNYKQDYSARYTNLNQDNYEKENN